MCDDCTMVCLHRMHITTVEYTGAGTRRDMVVEEIQQQQHLILGSDWRCDLIITVLH